MDETVQTQIDTLAAKVDALETNTSILAYIIACHRHIDSQGLVTMDPTYQDVPDHMVEQLNTLAFCRSPTPPGDGDHGGGEVACPNCDGEKVIYFDDRDGGDGIACCQACEGRGLVPAPDEAAKWEAVIATAKSYLTEPCQEMVLVVKAAVSEAIRQGLVAAPADRAVAAVPQWVVDGARREFNNQRRHGGTIGDGIRAALEAAAAYSPAKPIIGLTKRDRWQQALHADDGVEFHLTTDGGLPANILHVSVNGRTHAFRLWPDPPADRAVADEELVEVWLSAYDKSSGKRRMDIGPTTTDEHVLAAVRAVREALCAAERGEGEK